MPSWRFYEWELGSDQPTTLVESIPTGTGRVDTREFEGRTFLIRFTSNFEGTELFDLTQRLVEVTYTLTSVTVGLFRLGSEPQSGMAQRLNPRDGRGVLAF